jgi:predicted dithiol-disulfide oxidoreductase (DUF899 family)
MSMDARTNLTEFPSPAVVDRDDWQQTRDELLVREKAHTRAGDALAAARRNLPMTPVVPATLIGADGPVDLVDAFDGHRMLIVYCFMWHHGKPHSHQCEGCTLSQAQIAPGVLPYLEARDVAYAVFSEGPYDELAAYRDFMGWPTRWYSTSRALDNPAVAGGGPLRCFLRDRDDVYLTYETAGRGTEVLDTCLRLLDLTPYGRQETWEDAPTGVPQVPASSWWRQNGSPVAHRIVDSDTTTKSKA